MYTLLTQPFFPAISSALCCLQRSKSPKQAGSRGQHYLKGLGLGQSSKDALARMSSRAEINTHTLLSWLLWEALSSMS